MFLTSREGLIVARRDGRGWRAELQLAGRRVQSVAHDPLRPELVYCGTFGDGLFRSDDAGATWQPAHVGNTHDKIMSLAVSSVERANGRGVVYAGTEPSAVFRSEDGGDRWRELTGLTDLPSSREWSFPPRPQTHHVRHIEPDAHTVGRLYVAIEAGALVRTDDAGRTWRDRVPGGPRDTHTLATHPTAPNRLYSAAGDGYFESRDGGDTWQPAGGSRLSGWARPVAGLKHGYLWSLAVDPQDPEGLVVTAAAGPRQAHDELAESVVYRRRVGAPWTETREGLPSPQGRRVALVAAHAAEPGVFYLASEVELYRSADAGASWERLEVEWPGGRRPMSGGWGFAVAEIG
jgi:photosystem II stability/assembly factor-like uncharacterized protein